MAEFSQQSLSKFIDHKNNFPLDSIIERLNFRLPYLIICPCNKIVHGLRKVLPTIIKCKNVELYLD